MHFLIKFTLIFTVLFASKVSYSKAQTDVSSKILFEESFEKTEKNEKDDSEKNFEANIPSSKKELITLNQEKFYHFSKNKLKNFYLKNISPPPNYTFYKFI